MVILKLGRRLLLLLFFIYTEVAFVAAAFFYLMGKEVRLYVFDIDNTLANTWPSFLAGYDSESKRLKTLGIFINMRKWLLDISRDPNNKVLFLSARPVIHYLTTISWLKGNHLKANLMNVFLVNNVNDKVKLLTKVKKFHNRIYYIDDLSYAHETGQVLFYNDVIASVEKLRLNYIGYDEIQNIIYKGVSDA